MAEEIKKIITVETGKAESSLKDYKSAIDKLRASLLDLDSTSEEYKTIAEEIRAKQEKLSEVMNVGKNNSNALAGSYNDLVNKLKVLRTEWRQTNDEATRSELGKQMNDINNQLKDLDASVGNFSRNVGNYEQAFQQAFTKSLEGVTGLKGPVKDISTMFANLVPLFRNAQVAGVGAFTAIKGAIASTGIGLLVVAIGQVISWLGQLSDKADEEAEKAKQRAQELKDFYDQKLGEYKDIQKEFYTEQEQLAIKFVQAKNTIELGAQAERQKALEKYNADMAGLQEMWENGSYQMVEHYIAAKKKRTEEYNQEIAKLKEKEEQTKANITKKYQNLDEQRRAQNVVNQLNAEKKQLKIQLDLQQAQARSQIKDKAKLHAELTKLEKEYYNALQERQRQALVKMYRFNIQGNELVKQIYQGLKDEQTQTQTQRINFETNAAETAKQIKSSMASASASVDKYAENYKKALDKIELEKKEKLFITDRDVDDENERQNKMTQVKLDAIEKQIQLEEQRKEHYKKDADKQIEINKQLIDLYQQQLDLQRQQTKEIEDQNLKRLQTFKQEQDNVVKKLETKASQESFDADYDIEDEQARAQRKYEIEQGLIQDKIALAQEYLNEVTGNAELQAKAEENLAALQQQLANNKKKRDYEIAQYGIKQAQLEAKRKEAAYKAGAKAVADIFGGISSLMEEGSEEAKAFALMEATVNTASSVVSAYKAGVATIPVPAWAGQALGIAQAAAAALQGAKQIQQIKQTNKENAGSGSTPSLASTSISAVGVNPLLDEQMDIDRLQRIQMYGDSETEKDTRVYVVESDIEEVKNRVQIRESNATF